MADMETLKKRLGDCDEHVLHRCLESAAIIVRNYIGRIVIPETLNKAVVRVAELLYQRRMPAEGSSGSEYMHDVVRLLDAWRMVTDAEKTLEG